jgi:hypothetical protein
MAFRIQHTDSGLFWGVNSNDRITLGDIHQSSVYDMSCEGHIKNVNTGKCLCKRKHHLVESEHDGHATDFTFTINLEMGEVINFSQNLAIIYDSGSVDVSRSAPTRWTVVPFEAEAEVDDVPVARGAALIEEALNAAMKPVDPGVPDLVSDTEEPEEEVPDLVSDTEEPEAEEEN